MKIYNAIPLLERIVIVGEGYNITKIATNTLYRLRIRELEDSHWIRIEHQRNQKIIYKGTRFHRLFQFKTVLESNQGKNLITFYNQLFPDKFLTGALLPTFQSAFNQFIKNPDIHMAKMIRSLLITSNLSNIKIVGISPVTPLFQSDRELFQILTYLNKPRARIILHNLLNPKTRKELRAQADILAAYNTIHFTNFYRHLQELRTLDLIIPLEAPQDTDIQNIRDQQLAITKKGLASLILYQILEELHNATLDLKIYSITPLSRLMDIFAELKEAVDLDKIPPSEFDQYYGDIYLRLVTEALAILKAHE